MVLFNYSSKELTAKIVYYGPALGGKTSSLEYIYKGLPAKVKGKMLSLSTQTDRTLFFDFLPMELGKIYGWRVRVQLYTVPGQVFYDATRKIVLKGADGVVFVVDSQAQMLNANLESWQNFQDNLKANNIDFAIIPLIIQYNKRDIKNILSIAELEQKINTRNVPYFETIATDGNGVLDALKSITKIVLQHLQKQYNKVFQEEHKEETQKKQAAPQQKEISEKKEPIAATPYPKMTPQEIKKPVVEAVKPKEKIKTVPDLAPIDPPTTKIEVENYEEIGDEYIEEFPVKDEELNLDAGSWQQIEIGRANEPEKIEQPVVAEPEDIAALDEPEIEELQELQIINDSDEIFVDDPRGRPADRLSDTWKTTKSKITAEPKPKTTKEQKDKTLELTAELLKVDKKPVIISALKPLQQAMLPVEIKIDTEKGIMNITLKITFQLKTTE
jgi:mutual gliding-motility protein MglA